MIAGEQAGILLEMPGQSQAGALGQCHCHPSHPTQPWGYFKDNVCIHRSHRDQCDSWDQRGWQRHKVSGAQSKSGDKTCTLSAATELLPQVAP